jgi:hypothetical protein
MFNLPGPKHPDSDNDICLYGVDFKEHPFEEVAKEVRDCVDAGGVVSFAYQGNPLHRGKMWKEGKEYRSEYGFYMFWIDGEHDEDLERLMLLVMEI